MPVVQVAPVVQRALVALPQVPVVPVPPAEDMRTQAAVAHMRVRGHRPKARQEDRPKAVVAAVDRARLQLQASPGSCHLAVAWEAERPSAQMRTCSK